MTDRAPTAPTERVQSADDVASLASRILGTRTRPLVVVSTDPHTEQFALDLDELRDGIRDLADVVLISTGPLTWALDELLPDRTQVYGGAGRSYPADFGADPVWQRSPLRFPGPKATANLVGDVLTQANAAGLFEQREAARKTQVTGTIKGFVADETRAIVDVDGNGMATISRELTYAPIPLDWTLHIGQRISGVLDVATNRIMVEQPTPSIAVLADAFPHHSVTLALVKKATAARATLLLHPAVGLIVRQADVSPNPLDSVDLLLAEGDVVAVRVLHLSDGTLHLSLVDVEDDEPIVPPLVLTAGGSPWLAEGRALAVEARDDAVGELAALDSRAEVVANATRTDAAATPIDEPPAELPTARAVPAVVPGPGRRRVVTPATLPEAEPTAEAPHADSAHGSALQSTQLQLAAARTQIAELERKLREAGADDSSLQRLRAQVSGAEARLRQELAARGEAERRNRDLEQQRRASTQALREARRSAPSAAEAPDLDARRARWGADDAWVRHEMYLAWVDRVDAADRAAWPLRDFVVGSEFAASLRSLDTGQFEKALRAAVDAVTGRIRHLPAREAHPLRTGDGAGDPDTVRASDGAKCWRAYIEQKTPAARRIHYWALPGGGVELSRIVTHDDVEP